MLRFLLRLAPAFIVYSAANAQAPPVTPDLSGGPPTIISPPPNASPNSSRPPPKFMMPDGFGGLKEEPSTIDSAPDQTGSTTIMPEQPLSEPNDSDRP
jgi:hypothetical protein